MINILWLLLLLGGLITGALNGHLEAVTAAIFDASKTAIMTIALPLSGIMALWLGMMRLAEKSGLLEKLAHLLRPLLTRLFPDVPADHPAMGSMLMNIAANMLGLANAATPLGLRAMQDLQSLNKKPDTATNAMCTFLAINTSSVQLIPATAIGILAAAGAIHPSSIIGTTLVATASSCVAGITAAKLLQRLPCFAIPLSSVTEEKKPLLEPHEVSVSNKSSSETILKKITPLSFSKKIILFLFGSFFLYAFVKLIGKSPQASPWINGINTLSLLAIPFLIGFFPLYAFLRGVAVYEEFVEGAKEGFQVALRIFPYLVAILVAIGVFRAAGGIDFLSHLLAPLLDRIGLPSQLLPLILVRPLSGSAATGLFAEIVKSAGPNSFVSQLAGTILGSTETTFYVLAVYFGSIAIKRSRHALAAGLIADTVGVVVSLIICHYVLG
ncbi:MAG: spore maturation protein [Chthoniobacterales bacterium]|nr:spore maturation protein [Chthoniobacterales bacterium]